VDVDVREPGVFTNEVIVDGGHLDTLARELG